MTARWIEQPVDEDTLKRLCEECEWPRPLLRILVRRGAMNGDAVDRFLRPRLSDFSDPFSLPGMRPAVDRLWQAVKDRERITVYGDYDVDGLTATALLTRVLRALGAQVTPFLPEREDDGYGLQVDTLHKCVQAQRCSLLVTVDCGTRSVEAVEQAAALGVDVIITDHHEPGSLPAPAVATVNPLLGGEQEPWRHLSGVGVAFKLCHALLKIGRAIGCPEADFDLRPYMDLVALGTIADMVPLTGENRTLARYGLSIMSDSHCPGIRALLAVTRIAPPLTSYHVGFLLGPRLNAAGRMGLAQRGLELLLTDDPARAHELAMELDAENRARQLTEKETLGKALAGIEAARYNPETDFAVVAAGHGWHAGVIGIVASRLVKAFHRPAVVIALDGEGGGRGSCRSIKHFNMVDALANCASELRQFGGHRMAAGLEVEEARLDAFIRAFQEEAGKRLKGDDLVPEVEIDSWVALDEVDAPLSEAQELLHPTGQGNPSPVWAVRGARMQHCREVGEGHLKCEVVIGNTARGAIGFNLWSRELTDRPVDIAFRLQKNEFRGRIAYELNMVDFRVSPAIVSQA